MTEAIINRTKTLFEQKLYWKTLRTFYFLLYVDYSRNFKTYLALHGSHA